MDIKRIVCGEVDLHESVPCAENYCTEYMSSGLKRIGIDGLWSCHVGNWKRRRKNRYVLEITRYLLIIDNHNEKVDGIELTAIKRCRNFLPYTLSALFYRSWGFNFLHSLYFFPVSDCPQGKLRVVERLPHVIDSFVVG